ncbi:MAG TPA: carboxypeptidase-like regulatory domain-containing protein, partial [Mucilaginibacter sp.]|nr:carboxypeptidase-like regulatory domain-containing protein [Mucilaginibacter sp.]
MIARIFTLIIAFFPFSCFAQFTVSGKVLNRVDKKPVENVSVFLSNATIGGTTATDGSFKLANVKPGKYDLVVTDIAFETYSQAVIVESSNIKLPDIVLSPQTRSLKEVTIKYHADPNREKYLNWFKEAFLGNSDRAWECKILNPEILDLSFDPRENILKASSADFLIIVNNALGYRIKYLLTDFWMRDSLATKRVRYKGYSLFEELKGSQEQEAVWQRAREEIYANSPMHFFRAAIADKLDENNFRVQKLEEVPNAQRLPDSLITARINYFNTTGNRNRDSLAYWTGQSKLPRTSTILGKEALHKREIIGRSGSFNQYFLECNNCGLIVAYNKNHHFHINEGKESLYSIDNTDNTFIRFNSPQVLVYSMGELADPYELGYTGVWGRYRMAELLPQDFEPLHSMELRTGAEQLLTKLDSFSGTHRNEKAYLQFDKPYYAAGDTMYFKAYVTMDERHLLSQISGVLHVDLVNTADKIDKSIKLHLVNGIGWGDFALPDSLPGGYYR